MKYKDWMLWASLALNVLMYGYISVDMLLYYRPLLPTKQWQVKAGTHLGKPMPVKAYKMLGRDTFFLRIGNGDKVWDRWKHSQWFVMHFANNEELDVFVTCPGIFPFLYYQTDRYLGVSILDRKIDDLWHLSYTGDSAVFSNATYFVSATQKNSARPAVEVHRRTL